MHRAAVACTAAEEAAILATANAGTLATDRVDGDPVSFSGTTIYAGNNIVGSNAQFDLPARKVWELVVTVKMR